MGLPAALAGSVIMGAGISAMHYTGMEAMRLSAMCHYWLGPRCAFRGAGHRDFPGRTLADVVHFRNDVRGKWLPKIATAALMGAAIPGNALHRYGSCRIYVLPV